MDFREAGLSTIDGGHAIELFDYELEKVVQNCIDLNTDSTVIREVRLTVKIKPTQDRTGAAFSYQATSKIAHDAPGTGQLHFSQDGKAFVPPTQTTIDFEGMLNQRKIESLKVEEND